MLCCNDDLPTFPPPPPPAAPTPGDATAGAAAGFGVGVSQTISGLVMGTGAGVGGGFATGAGAGFGTGGATIMGAEAAEAACMCWFRKSSPAAAKGFPPYTDISFVLSLCQNSTANVKSFFFRREYWEIKKNLPPNGGSKTHFFLAEPTQSCLRFVDASAGLILRLDFEALTAHDFQETTPSFGLSSEMWNPPLPLLDHYFSSC